MELPRLVAAHPRALEALRHLCDHPDEIDPHLLLGSGACLGRELYASGAAALIARELVTNITPAAHLRLVLDDVRRALPNPF